MRKIQKTSTFSMSRGNVGGGLGALTKTYNSDIRKLRENEETIFELDKLIKSVEN